MCVVVALSVPVAVTVTVYEPAGVAVPTLPPPPLLPPPQAGSKSNIDIAMPIISQPKTFLRRAPGDPNPIPISDRPATGSHIA